MELHHSKHHNTYVTSLNGALSTLAAAAASGDIPGQIAVQPLIKFHGGGHINHSLFWQNLAPASSAEAKPSSAPQLTDAIKRTWGDEQAFRDAFKAALLGIQGSGWGWLVKVEGQAKEDRLTIVTTKDQDPIVGKGEVPIFGVDMWEHAYYLQVSFALLVQRRTPTDPWQYLNGKAAYVDNIWNIINWKTAEERYLGKQADAFKVLKASI